MHRVSEKQAATEWKKSFFASYKMYLRASLELQLTLLVVLGAMSARSAFRSGRKLWMRIATFWIVRRWNGLGLQAKQPLLPLPLATGGRRAQGLGRQTTPETKTPLLIVLRGCSNGASQQSCLPLCAPWPLKASCIHLS